MFVNLFFRKKDFNAIKSLVRKLCAAKDVCVFTEYNEASYKNYFDSIADDNLMLLRIEHGGNAYSKRMFFAFSDINISNSFGDEFLFTNSRIFERCVEYILSKEYEEKGEALAIKNNITLVYGIYLKAEDGKGNTFRFYLSTVETNPTDRLEFGLFYRDTIKLPLYVNVEIIQKNEQTISEFAASLAFMALLPKIAVNYYLDLLDNL